MNRNYPKKLNVEKAIEEFSIYYEKKLNVKLSIYQLTTIKTCLNLLAEYIPAYEANFTNIEQVQRINKFLTEDK